MAVFPISRRALLRSTGLLAGTALASRFVPGELWAESQAPSAKEGAAALAASRAAMAKVPIERTKLTPTGSSC